MGESRGGGRQPIGPDLGGDGGEVRGSRKTVPRLWPEPLGRRAGGASEMGTKAWLRDQAIWSEVPGDGVG